MQDHPKMLLETACATGCIVFISISDASPECCRHCLDDDLGRCCKSCASLKRRVGAVEMQVPKMEGNFRREVPTLFLAAAMK